jgi:carbon storage regulator
MLILSRKLGERIIIADDIVVTVAQIERGKVRLGIQAPAKVPILREELQPRLPPSPSTAIGAGD